ncbi:MAG TPA: caspase family protein [Kiritimatiellia bacterium]|nr:caspase family protein [Kiritimatiellia bacterium]HRZ10902.1 caspase family protein [Kiritimatiellia bacterium]HSA18825.1 caspase family protein [Kiritimatiellia bacterium]
MKRTAALLLALGLCFGLVFYLGHSASRYRGAAPVEPGPAARPGPLAFHAVVIGASDYSAAGGRGWEDLQTARADAEAIADVLQRRYGFTVEVLTGQRASKAGILTALDRLADLTDRDAALIYYAGHGHYDATLDEGFWIPADARRTVDGRDAREDWIWNSMITKMVNASRARHILVVADSCYAGSLFRGDGMPAEREWTWYARAFHRPSRYLVASGDLEPVLDSGIEHSMFAGAVLEFLENPVSPVFSASDMALAVRQKVGELTGQMVRMGPLAVSSHAGGEFVFTSDPSRLELADVAADPSAQQRSPETAEPPGDLETARDALWMQQAGLAQSARRLTAEASPEAKPVTAAVAAYLDPERRRGRQDALRELIEQVREQPPRADAADRVRPRVLACLGPDPTPAGGEEQVMARLIRICLTAALQGQTRIVAVERENLEAALQELQLGVSSLSDAQAQLQVGRFLPASILLLGDMARQDGRWVAWLRLVDTETSRILKSWNTDLDPANLQENCREIAADIARAVAEMRPLEAAVTRAAQGGYRVAIGSFHGLDPQAALDVLADGKPAGSAAVTRLGIMESDIAIEFAGGGKPGQNTALRVRERQP